MKITPLFTAVLSLLLAVTAGAQSNKGGIQGTVFDETGSVVAAATVVITNLGTGEKLELTTSTSGTFSAPMLDPVEYRVEVAAQGFKPSVIQRVKVDTATTAAVKVTLAIGDRRCERQHGHVDNHTLYVQHSPCKQWHRLSSAEQRSQRVGGCPGWIISNCAPSPMGQHLRPRRTQTSLEPARP